MSDVIVAAVINGGVMTLIAIGGALVARHGYRKMDENTVLTKQTRDSTHAIAKATNGLLAQSRADARALGVAEGETIERDKHSDIGTTNG